MIKNKLIKARKEKYTQESMAKILHMTQSQYQRREKGEIKISDDEWERIAKALDTTVEDIKEEDIPQSIINNYDNSSGSYFPHINNNYSIPEFILKKYGRLYQSFEKTNRRTTRRNSNFKILEFKFLTSLQIKNLSIS